jgi:hypothetical protein
MGAYYVNAEQYLNKIDRGAWLEIGVERGEGSTRWFSSFAKTLATKFYAVDAMASQCDAVRSLLLENGKLPDHIEVINDFGENFLLNFHTRNEKISLAYLDNFDWDYWLGRQEESFVPIIKDQYRQQFNTEMNNINSQYTHLVQAMLIYNYMTDNSIIICDDTWYHPAEGIFIGKCSAAIPYLCTQGFEVIHYEGYRQNSGVILGRFKR